jgi:hypothetical protein
VRTPWAGVAVVISISEIVLHVCIEFVSHKAALMSNPSCCLPLCDLMTRAVMEQAGDRAAAGCGSTSNVGNQATRGGLLGDNNSGDCSGSNSSSGSDRTALAADLLMFHSKGIDNRNCSGSASEARSQVSCVSYTPMLRPCSSQLRLAHSGASGVHSCDNVVVVPKQLVTAHRKPHAAELMTEMTIIAQALV